MVKFAILFFMFVSKNASYQCGHQCFWRNFVKDMESGTERSRIIKVVVTWIKKWNKPLAAFVAFLVFTSMFITTLVEISQEHKTTTSNFKELTTGSQIEDRLRDVCYVDSDCTVRCKGVIDRAVVATVNELLESDKTEDCQNHMEIKLVLEDAYFTNNCLSNAWLDGLSKDVEELTISSQQLTDIGEYAFAGNPFDYLKSLIIEDSRIRVLKRESFLNSRIETFEFRCTNIITMEYDALGPISNYLTILQFSRCIDDINAIINITGNSDTMFNKLTELDLRYNSFNRILNNTFIGAPKLVALYLIENNIQNVDVNAFKGIQGSIQLLSLKDNVLATLPEGVFNGLTRSGQIDITGNPWNCNCSLQWLKDFYIENLQYYFNNGSIPFLCIQGNYSDVDFCPDGSTPTTTVTKTTAMPTPTVSPGIVTTPDPSDYIYLDCKDLTLPASSIDGKNRLFSHSAKVRHGNVTYNFYQIEGTPNFEIKVLNNIGSDYLIWINSRNSSDYGCVHNVNEIVQLDNLHYGLSYTICLLKEKADTVSPFDCTSLTVPLEWRDLPWVQNKYIPIVIGAIVGVALVIIIITSTIMFYTIRQNPKMIKGNKRVVIVRNKSADALVMPNYERQPYVPPSIYTNSAGYLTPRHKTYERINERRFRHLNTITEKFYRDMSSDSRSTYQPESFHRRSVGSGLYEAPPLPPNHPSERFRSSPRPHTSNYYK